MALWWSSIMKRSLIGLGLAASLGALDLGASPARAQLPGESVVYETVAPASRSVTYGERTKIKYRGRKTIIKERPVAYITRNPAVVRETRYFQPAPVVQSQIIQPAPVIESRVVQPAPIIESRVVQPAPIIETRFVQPAPVVESRLFATDPVARARYTPQYPY